MGWKCSTSFKPSLGKPVINWSINTPPSKMTKLVNYAWKQQKSSTTNPQSRYLTSASERRARTAHYWLTEAMDNTWLSRQAYLHFLLHPNKVISPLHLVWAQVIVPFRIRRIAQFAWYVLDPIGWCMVGGARLWLLHIHCSLPNIYAEGRKAEMKRNGKRRGRKEWGNSLISYLPNIWTTCIVHRAPCYTYWLQHAMIK